MAFLTLFAMRQVFQLSSMFKIRRWELGCFASELWPGLLVDYFSNMIDIEVQGLHVYSEKTCGLCLLMKQSLAPSLPGIRNLKRIKMIFILYSDFTSCTSSRTPSSLWIIQIKGARRNNRRPLDLWKAESEVEKTLRGRRIHSSCEPDSNSDYPWEEDDSQF